VWQRHLAEQEAERQRREQEKELGKQLPTGRRAPVCPTCKSSFLQVAYTGPVVHALVNTADPAAGVQDVVVDPDVAQLEKVAWVRCASCWEPLADGPRRPGSPARRAAAEIAEDASWADVPWEVTNPSVVKEEETGRASRIVLQHDLARGAIRRVSRWEYLTGITDAEREKMRAERLARGEPYDYDLADDAEPDLVDAARDQDTDLRRRRRSAPPHPGRQRQARTRGRGRVRRPGGGRRGSAPFTGSRWPCGTSSRRSGGASKCRRPPACSTCTT
jgi:hypothetical protein